MRKEGKGYEEGRGGGRAMRKGEGEGDIMIKEMIKK